MDENIHGDHEFTPDEPLPEKPLNFLGLVLMFVTVLVTFGVAFPITLWITGQLRWGIYPRILLVVPIVAVGFGFWAGMYKLCEVMGIPLEKDHTVCPGCRRPLSEAATKQCSHCGAAWR